MIAAEPHRSRGQKEAHVEGWLVSVLLHGTVALTAILLVKQIQLVPQNESFKWNVAMASPAQPVQPTTSPRSQAPTTSAPSTTSVPSPHMQQATPTQTLPSLQPFAQQATPSISAQTVTPMVTEPPAPPIPQSATHTIQPAEPIRHETMASTAVSTESAAQTASLSASSAVLEQTAQSDQAPASTQIAAISPAPMNAPTKRDYAWLSDTILRRVEELKRYPASARMDRAEGKVVVKAVINEDGSIGVVEIFQSSGHPGLDKAAIETLRQAAPFQLPRPLGQPGMTIKIPMSYRLDR